MKVGDLVIRKSSQEGLKYCIIDFKADENGECIAVLKALYNEKKIVDAPLNELESVLVKGKL